MKRDECEGRPAGRQSGAPGARLHASRLTLHPSPLTLHVFLLLSLLPAAGAATPVVCIDPGHPSETSSGGGRQNGTSEVHINWLVAQKLRALLQARGCRVVMTKSSEGQFVRNRDRALAANKAGARLMVRLHCDANPARGFALYYPNRAGTRYGATGPPPDVRRRSKEAAQILHAALAKALRGALKDGGVRGDSQTKVGSRQGALTGSIFIRTAVVTIEMVGLGYKPDAQFIKSPAGQDRMARALADGVMAYVSAGR